MLFNTILQFKNISTKSNMKRIIVFQQSGRIGTIVKTKNKKLIELLTYNHKALYVTCSHSSFQKCHTTEVKTSCS